jgi:hypothetical protein
MQMHFATGKRLVGQVISAANGTDNLANSTLKDGQLAVQLLRSKGRKTSG